MVRRTLARSLALAASAASLLTTGVRAEDRQLPAMNPVAASHLARAAEAAGDRWGRAYGYLCGPGPRLGNRVSDPALTPRWIFDDLAILGDRGTAIYALRTSAGVVLIDSGYSTKAESLLLPGLAQLGLNPADVKYVLVTHGHPDHFGGARLLQVRYGAHVIASAADWALITGPRTGLPLEVEDWMVAPGPDRDMALADGGELSLGGTRLRTVPIPGHTPGSLGVIFPVTDRGRPLMAAIFGGTILADGRIPDEGLRIYVRSLARFAEATRQAGVEVELQNHIMFDDTEAKLAALSSRGPQDPNPFVVGRDGYQAFLSVMSECVQAALARRP